jgi:hypothetical protein
MIKAFKYKNKNRYQAGFSLIQVFIYLIISSIILSISLTIFTCAINHKKIIENKLNNLTDKMLLDNLIGNLIIQKAYTKDEANKRYPGLDIKSDVILNSKNMLYFVSKNKGLINDKSKYGLFQFRLDSTEPKQLLLKGVNAIALSYLDKDGRISQINNSNKSSSNTYQHFMLHILTNFKGSSFVYDIRI